MCRCLQCAIAIDGRNPLARYEAAGVLAALERPQEALAELMALQVGLAGTHSSGICTMQDTLCRTPEVYTQSMVLLIRLARLLRSCASEQLQQQVCSSWGSLRKSRLLVCWRRWSGVLRHSLTALQARLGPGQVWSAGHAWQGS